MKQPWLSSLVTGILLCWNSPAAEPSQIVVHAQRSLHRVSPYLTGACLEDVNHEVYGGLYSQMIFGESFREPPSVPALRGFTAYGGKWSRQEDALWADAGSGPKLIANEPTLESGEVGVEVWLPGLKAGNAGLLLKVSDPANGADRFTGYEVSLDTSGKLILGRHRQNWEPLRSVPCPVPADQWIPLTVRLGDRSLDVLVHGTNVLHYQDDDHPLGPGLVGLRTWQREARFRRLYTKNGGQQRNLPFEAETSAHNGEVSGMWRGFSTGQALAELVLNTNNPFSGHQSQRIASHGGAGEVGIANQGLNRWGMSFVKGKTYDGFVWVRSNEPTEVFVSLESADGSRRYAAARLRVDGAQWKKASFTLKPSHSDGAGRFAITLKNQGSVDVGYAFLEPGPWGRFKGLPVRKDVAEALLAQGLTVVRYGGSMINSAEYRWKKMIGPPDLRPSYQGTWYPHSSNGWGIFDFLNFCEAARFLAVPAVNMDETAQDMADFMEYVNGDSTSAWGRRRAADGHPAPYGLKYLELGNEEAVNEAYWTRFKALAEAIWAKDPEVVLVVGDFAYDKAIQDPFQFDGAPLIRTLAAHKNILELAQSHNREVWFDVHIGTERPPDPRGLPGVRSFIQQLEKLCPGAKFKVAVFEFNAGNHAMKRALANACAINQLEQTGDRIAIACSANCLQPAGQNDNGWDQGLLFLNPSQVWAQPPYYVTQMFARDYLLTAVATEVHNSNGVLDVAAKISENGKSLVLQVVNTSAEDAPASLSLEGFVPRGPKAQVTVLSGDPETVNTAAQPNRVAPKHSEWRHGKDLKRSSFIFAPHSVTLIRFH